MINKYIVPYNKRMSEFEIQSLIFGILKKEGLTVRGEVKAHKSRLDLVVFDEQKKAQCIIEVKSRVKQRKNPRKYKQIIKYEELFKLPVIICLNQTQVQDTVNEVKRIMND